MEVHDEGNMLNTSALLEGNMFSLRSLCGYFNAASCFSFSIETAVRDEGTVGCSGQLIGERAWDAPATNCDSNERWGLGTGRIYTIDGKLEPKEKAKVAKLYKGDGVWTSTFTDMFKANTRWMIDLVQERQ